MDTQGPADTEGQPEPGGEDVYDADESFESALMKLTAEDNILDDLYELIKDEGELAEVAEKESPVPPQGAIHPAGGGEQPGQGIGGVGVPAVLPPAALAAKFPVVIDFGGFGRNCTGLQLLSHFTESNPLRAKSLVHLISDDGPLNPVSKIVGRANNSARGIPRVTCSFPKRFGPDNVPYPCAEHSLITLPCVIEDEPSRRSVRLTVCFKTCEGACKRRFWCVRVARRERAGISSRGLPSAPRAQAPGGRVCRDQAVVLLQQQPGLQVLLRSLRLPAQPVHEVQLLP